MASTAGLGSAMREEVWSIVRAAVDEAIGPLVARQRELEARLERAERSGGGAGGGAAARLASIPVTMGGNSAAPPPMPKAAPVPTALGPALLPAAFKPAAEPGLDLGPTPAAKRSAPTSAHPVGPRPSIPPQGYGVTVTSIPRASLDLDAVGPVDIEGFDGGRRKRTVARLVVVMMLLLIGGAVTMMILSYN
jgi:hypothetical protein